MLDLCMLLIVYIECWSQLGTEERETELSNMVWGIEYE